MHEKEMQAWLRQHNELPTGKHALGDIHRRYKRIKKQHICDHGCNKIRFPKEEEK